MDVWWQIGFSKCRKVSLPFSAQLGAVGISFTPWSAEKHRVLDLRYVPIYRWKFVERVPRLIDTNVTGIGQGLSVTSIIFRSALLTISISIGIRQSPWFIESSSCYTNGTVFHQHTAQKTVRQIHYLSLAGLFLPSTLVHCLRLLARFARSES